MPPVETLRQFMAPRDSVAGRWELLHNGFDEARIDGWLRNGRLVQVLNGVYSFGRDVDTRPSVLRAALIAAGPGSLITGRSACEEWGLVDFAEAMIPTQVQIAVTVGQRRSLFGTSPAMVNTRIQIVRRDFQVSEILARRGLPVVNPALSLIDLAAGTSERELRFAYLEACRLKRFDLRDVNYCFDRMVGRRGAAILRPLLELWVPELSRTKSVLEGRFILDWPRDLPMPLVNVKVHGWEVDFFWPELKFVLEMDGGAFHSDPIARERDRIKTRSLESKGLKVKRVTWAEYDPDPNAVIQEIIRMHESTRRGK